VNWLGLIARWNALPARAKRVALGAVFVLAVVTGVETMLSHPARNALFAAPLHPEQLEEVQERLAAWNVSFTPSSDNVFVDAKRRGDLLLRLSLAGVPHAHVESSADTLAKIGALTPQAVVDAQTRQGLAADIELGLRGVDGVDDARVIVAPSKPAFFADEASRDATASVRLRSRPGAKLSRDAIAGMRAFVAASSPGLDPARVTIMDDRGLALGDGAADGDAGALEASLQSALDAALGTGASLVRVHVTYDGDTQHVHDVRRLPLSTGAIAASREDERYSGGDKRYVHATQQIDRGSDTRDTTTSSPPGRVARMSIAVFVNAARGIDLYKVRSLIAAAAGVDQRRGDQLMVQAIDFPSQLPVKRDLWWLAYGALAPLARTAVVAILILFAFRFAARPMAIVARSFAQRARVVDASAAVSGLQPTQVRGALRDEPPHAAAAVISALPAATAAAVLDMYPAHERTAIIERMNRGRSALVKDAESLLVDA